MSWTRSFAISIEAKHQLFTNLYKNTFAAALKNIDQVTLDHYYYVFPEEDLTVSTGGLIPYLVHPFDGAHHL